MFKLNTKHPMPVHNANANSNTINVNIPTFVNGAALVYSNGLSSASETYVVAAVIGHDCEILSSHNG